MKKVILLTNTEIIKLERKIEFKQSVIDKKMNSKFISENDRIFVLSLIEIIQPLKDTLIINKALGLINLRLCQEGGIKFDKLAHAIKRAKQ